MAVLYFSFDVESDGLTGKAFAVGWVVMKSTGEEIESGYLRSPHIPTDPWVVENVVPHLPPPNCKTEKEMLGKFWLTWMNFEKKGATLVGDCIFPVETNFLSACMKALCPEGVDPIEISPYPVIDVGSVLFGLGYDSLASYKRLPDELPDHHPTCDARQSVRILQELVHSGNFEKVRM